MVEVTRLDRDAAEAWRRDYGRKASYQDLLQAFARHRIAALEEAATELDRQDGYGEWSEAATAIRALKGPTDG